MSGDWNARVGKKLDFIIHDRNINGIGDSAFEPDFQCYRNTMDTTSNCQGQKLIDLCIMTSLILANGRLENDLQGSFTYTNYMGSSVIDFLMANENDFILLQNFTIGSFNEWSDHCPISFDTKCALKTDVNSSETDHVSIRWNEELKQDLRCGIIGKLNEFSALFFDQDISCQEDVNTCVTDFTNMINDVAEPLFLKRTSQNKSNAKCKPNYR